MSVSHKSFNAQLFRLMVYRRALHPELFEVEGRRCHRHGEFEAETWIAPAGHVARFQVGSQVLTEALIENGDHLPEHGLVHALPCLGEKDYELEPEGRISYVTTVHTETLTENLYMAEIRETRELVSESGALHFEWKDADGSPCMSVIDVQKYKRELHIQSYHLIGSAGLVLRSQSIFEVL